MAHRALITGNSDEIIDEFFTEMDMFETMTTSKRYTDVVRHIRCFVPDLFVYCIYKETKEDYSKIVPIKHLLSKHKIPFVVVGEKEDCEEFMRIAANISDLTLRKPMDADVVQKQISDFMGKWREMHPVQPAALPPAQFSVGANSGYAEQSAPPQAYMEQGASQQVKMAAMLSGGQGGDPMTTEDIQAEQRRRRRKHVAGRKGRILVIDDNPLMLKVIKEHLHEEYDVATAINGRVAFRFLESRAVDIILLDYEMPEEDGPTVLRRLRNLERTRDVPVIFLTGISDRKKIKKALLMKPEGYLLKPIDHEKLIQTIQRYIV